jgi:GNAT superfamily N-acetyltransferase
MTKIASIRSLIVHQIMPPRIRVATRDDVPTICRFVTMLAEYEKLLHQVQFTESLYRKYLFDDLSEFRPEVVVAETESGQPAGFALYIRISQTSLHLEDLFVDPSLRGKGIGMSLLASLAREALKRGMTELQWNCLDWNQPSIDFYESLGAVRVANRFAYRIAESSLDKDIGEIEINELMITRGIQGDPTPILVTHNVTKVSVEYSLSFTTFNGTPVIYVTDVDLKDGPIPDILVRYLIREAQFSGYSRIDVCLDPTCQLKAAQRLMSDFGAIEMVGWIPFRLQGEPLNRLAKRTSSV